MSSPLLHMRAEDDVPCANAVCKCHVQNLPDVMDLEVSPASGEWRIAGSQGAWLSIHDDPSRPLDASAVIKAEPQLGSAPAQAAAGGQCMRPCLCMLSF